MNNYKKYNNCVGNKDVEFKYIKASENKISATAVTKHEQYGEGVQKKLQDISIKIISKSR